MKGSRGRVGLLAVVVESLGGLALLMLLFPVSAEPSREATNGLPTLQIPALAFEGNVDGDTPTDADRRAERQQSVARQLDVTSRALGVLFDRHLQQLLQSPHAGADATASP